MWLWTRRDTYIWNQPDQFNAAVNYVAQSGFVLPDSVLSVTRVLPGNRNFFGYGGYTPGLGVDPFNATINGNLFNTMYDRSGGSDIMTNYYISNTYVGAMDDMFHTSPSIRYNMYNNRLKLDCDLKSLFNGKTMIILEAWVKNDPEVYPELWNHPWIVEMSTARMKKYWGGNLKKYDGVQLAGGVSIDGQKIYDEGLALETEMTERLMKSNVEMDSILIG
jgi:hypothetical protein